MLGDETLEQVVIQAHPVAQATYDIAKQLSEQMPLDTLDDFVAKVEKCGLSVCGEAISAKQIRHVLPEKVFPIRTQAELVEKVASAVGTGIEIIRRGGVAPKSDSVLRLAAKLAADAGPARSGTAVGFFEGPSLFGAGPEQEND